MKIPSPLKDAGQFLRTVLFGSILLVLIAAWFALHEDAPPEIIPPAPAQTPHPAPPTQIADSPPPRIPSIPTPAPAPTAASRPPAASSDLRPASVMEMEREYLRTTDPRERAATAAAVVSIGTAEAVAAAARLFYNERDPRAREALIAALADLPAEDFLDARLPLLTKAMARSQPRSVRTAALDVLATLDDPRARALLLRAARDDPDKELREAAAAHAADDTR